MNIGPLVAIVPVVLAVAMIILIIRRNITGRSESISRDITAAIPAIVILMVAALLIGSFASTVDKNVYEVYDCVPLSSFGSGATIEGDCVETVTIGDTEYVRMTDLGTFTVSSGEKSKEYKVTKAKLDLVLLTGQSNSLFYTAPSFYTGDSPVAPGKAFYFGTETPDGNYAGIPRSSNASALDSAEIVDVTNDSGSVNIAAMYPAFCSDYVQETGHRVLVVNTGVGGQSIYQWLDGYPCDLWMHDVFDRLDEVVSDGKVELTPTVALWSQGESDAAQTVGWYKYHLEKVLENLWGGDYGYKFRNVLSVLPRHSSIASPTNPAIAQEQVASQQSGFTIASSLPVHFTSAQTRDGIHYTQTVYGWLGEAFARSAASVMGYRTVAESLVLPIDVGVVASLPDKAGVYGTSGKTYDVTATWTVTSDPSVYDGALSGAPSGTALIDGLSTQAIPSNPAFFTFSEDGASITGITSAAAGASMLVLPSSYNGTTITAIGDNAFSSSEIVGVCCLPDTSITTIGSRAFKNCASLTSVSLPKATAIPYECFNGCLHLETVDLPSAASSAYTAFQNCKALVDVELPSLTRTNGGLFINCLALKTVSLPSIQTMKANDFQYCMAIESVTFGDGLAEVASSTFPNWTFYASDGTTTIDKTVASNLAGHTFAGTASALVMQS